MGFGESHKEMTAEMYTNAEGAERAKVRKEFPFQSSLAKRFSFCVLFLRCSGFVWLI